MFVCVCVRVSLCVYQVIHSASLVAGNIPTFTFLSIGSVCDLGVMLGGSLTSSAHDLRSS